MVVHVADYVVGIRTVGDHLPKRPGRFDSPQCAHGVRPEDGMLDVKNCAMRVWVICLSIHEDYKRVSETKYLLPSSLEWA